MLDASCAYVAASPSPFIADVEVEPSRIPPLWAFSHGEPLQQSPELKPSALYDTQVANRQQHRSVQNPWMFWYMPPQWTPRPLSPTLLLSLDLHGDLPLHFIVRKRLKPSKLSRTVHRVGCTRCDHDRMVYWNRKQMWTRC